MVPDADDSPVKQGLVMFASFLVFGSAPLLVYILFPVFLAHLHADVLLAIACAVTGVVLFALGVLKSFFSVMRWWHSGLEFLLLGGAVAATSYFIGLGVSKLTEEALAALPTLSPTASSIVPGS